MRNPSETNAESEFGPIGRIARDQIREWRKIMAWSDGEGLDPATVSDLLDEIEWLQCELAAAQRKLAARNERS